MLLGYSQIPPEILIYSDFGSILVEIGQLFLVKVRVWHGFAYFYAKRTPQLSLYLPKYL